MRINRKCTFLFLCLFTFLNSDAALPDDVMSELAKQQVALTNVYLVIEQTTLRSNREVRFTQTALFQGDRFRMKAPADVAFDGEVLWHVSKRPTNEIPAAILRKTKIRNTPDATSSFNQLYWRFPYFDAAGIYCPPYPKDLRSFRMLEPIVLRFLENNESFEVSNEGEHLRLHFVVDDWVLLNFREIDPQIFRKEIEGSSPVPEAKSNAVNSLVRAQTMHPKRSVSLLLDANHGYAPVEREDRTADGQLIARYKVEQWKFFEAPGIWLPEKCSIAYFTGPYSLDQFAPDPIQIVKLELKLADFEAREETFVLIEDPNYRVAGNEVHDETIYNVEDGIRRPVALTIAADGRLIKSGAYTVNIGSRKMMIALVLVTLAIPPIIYVLRNFRMRH